MWPKCTAYITGKAQEDQDIKYQNNNNYQLANMKMGRVVNDYADPEFEKQWGKTAFKTNLQKQNAIIRTH